MGVTFPWIVLVVRYAKFIFVCLNILLLYAILLPVYVNVAHFCLGISIFEFLACFLGGFLEFLHG
jgi:hypothetical protein